jgi:DNA-binding HxlR family transcriptional regulator
MLGRLYENQDCSAARTLEVVGERWSLLILRDAMFRRSARFSEFERSLAVAPNILAKRLTGFVEAGIMEARDGGEYHLTEKGLDLKPVIIALTAWGDKWIGPGPIVYVHEGCGGEIGQNLRCAACGREPGLADIVGRLSEAPRPLGRMSGAATAETRARSRKPGSRRAKVGFVTPRGALSPDRP